LGAPNFGEELIVVFPGSLAAAEILGLGVLLFGALRNCVAGVVSHDSSDHSLLLGLRVADSGLWFFESSAVGVGFGRRLFGLEGDGVAVLPVEGGLLGLLNVLAHLII
jgi:hypothetical protein